MKLFVTLLFSLILSPIFACHLSSASLTSALDNGDGTYTITMNICIAEDGAFGETFNFAVQASGGSFTSIASYGPSTLSNTYQVYGGGYGPTLNITGNATSSIVGGGSAVLYSSGPSTPQLGWPLVSDGSWCAGSCTGGGLQYCFTSTITTNGAPNNMGIIGAEGGICATINLSMGTLPIELLSFSAKQNEKVNLLKWVTATEISNEKFIIQRSSDGANYEDIGTIEGHGTTTKEIHYSFTDESPIEGLNYYQLVQVDFDGKQTNYGPAIVNYASNENLVVYPNPISYSGELQLRIPKSMAAVDYRIEVYNNMGLNVMSEKRHATEPTEFIYTVPTHKCNFTENSDGTHASLNLQNLPVGTYICVLSSSTDKLSAKFVIK